jgi:hypothetical protein
MYLYHASNCYQELQSKDGQLKESTENQEKTVNDFRLISENYLKRLDGVRKQITQLAAAKKDMKKVKKDNQKYLETIQSQSEDLEKRLKYAISLEAQLKAVSSKLQYSSAER